MTHSFQALGTTWWIEIFDEIDTQTLAIVFADCERFVAKFEANYSRFRADSLISILNRQRTLDNPSPHCRDLIQYGKGLYLRTNTYFNMLQGHILEARGYDEKYSFVATNESTLTAGNPVFDLHISKERIELQHGNLDIGGFGKGYLIDEVAQLLQTTHQLHYFLINAGGDMFVTSNYDQPVEIALEHPTTPGLYIKKATLLHQGFAASSPYKRQWKHQAQTYSHIVSPSAITAASFITAATAREADAFATTALIAPRTEIESLAHSEHLGIAFFDPHTNTITSNQAFPLA